MKKRKVSSRPHQAHAGKAKKKRAESCVIRLKMSRALYEMMEQYTDWRVFGSVASAIRSAMRNAIDYRKAMATYHTTKHTLRN